MSGWRLLAKCRGSSPAVFYPEHDNRDSRPVRLAKAICATCPVSRECLADAIETMEQYGIRGGTTPEERGTKYLRTCECGVVFRIEKRKGRAPAYCSQPCKDAARERQRWESYERTNPAAGQWMARYGHGLISRYQRGCRCEACTKAARVARAESRAKKRAVA